MTSSSSRRSTSGGARPEIALSLATLALFVALAIYGAVAHPIEIVGSAEQDGHVARAEQLLRGELPRDPLRPMLYPLLAAAVATTGLETFAAARLVSNLASAALAAVAWGLGWRLGGRATAWVAFALMAVHPFVWTGGQAAATDPLFSLLGALLLLVALTWIERPAGRLALLGGALFGLALSTRGNALFLLPSLALAPLFAGRGAWRERWRDAALALAAFVVVATPHFCLRYLEFGSPFHDENWRSLAFKLYGGGDWRYLERAPFGSVAAVIAASPWRFVESGLDQLGLLVRTGGMGLSGRPEVALLAIVGFGLAVARRRAIALWLALAAAFYAAALAFAFFVWPRLLSILLPPVLAFAAVPLGRVGRELALRLAPRAAARQTWLPGAATAIGAVVVVLLLAERSVAVKIPAFVAAHPIAEARALSELSRRSPPDAVLAGCMSFFSRQVRGRFVEAPPPSDAEVGRPELYLERLHALFEREGVDWLVVGRVALQDRPASLLGAAAPVPWLEPAGGSPEARIWRVVSTGAGG